MGISHEFGIGNGKEWESVWVVMVMTPLPWELVPTEVCIVLYLYNLPFSIDYCLGYAVCVNNKAEDTKIAFIRTNR